MPPHVSLITSWPEGYKRKAPLLA